MDNFFPQDLIQELKILEWGYTAEKKARSFNFYQSWVKKGLHGSLGYLADHRGELREDLVKVFPEFKSAFVFLFDYSAIKKQMVNEESLFNIAGYAFACDGLDYHFVLKERLKKIEAYLKEHFPKLKSFYSIDAQPVLERDLAYRAGLGWFGKNSMLINRNHGSYFLIASLLVDHEFDLPKKEIETDHCGTCMRCIELCPTNAIDEKTKTLEAEKCISTFTIEHFKETDAPKGIEKGAPKVFGCDICQEVCPWNDKKLLKVSENLDNSLSSSLKNFFMNRPIKKIIDDLKSMSNREFKRKFKGTVFERTGRPGLLKNYMLFKKSTEEELP